MWSSHVKIKIDKTLYQRLEATATAAGYSSTDEFVRHVLERTADAAEDDDDHYAARQLRGLGYLEP